MTSIEDAQRLAVSTAMQRVNARAATTATLAEFIDHWMRENTDGGSWGCCCALECADERSTLPAEILTFLAQRPEWTEAP